MAGTPQRIPSSPHTAKAWAVNKYQITCREVVQKKHPIYSLHRPRDPAIFEKAEKVVGVITGDRITVAIDNDSYYASDGLYVFGVKEFSLPLIIGILNSRLLVFLYRLLSLESGRVLAQVKPAILDDLPIPSPASAPRFTARSKRIVELVNQMMSLTSSIPAAKSDLAKASLERQITATDRQIDELVYELYELTPEEIKIVEEATA